MPAAALAIVSLLANCADRLQPRRLLLAIALFLVVSCINCHCFRLLLSLVEESRLASRCCAPAYPHRTMRWPPQHEGRASIIGIYKHLPVQSSTKSSYIYLHLCTCPHPSANSKTLSKFCTPKLVASIRPRASHRAAGFLFAELHLRTRVTCDMWLVPWGNWREPALQPCF